MKLETVSVIWIKICATTNLDDALAGIDAGANALGFILTESPRRITPEAAARNHRRTAAVRRKDRGCGQRNARSAGELANGSASPGSNSMATSRRPASRYRRALGLRKIIKTLQARELLADPSRLDDYLRNAKSIDGILLDSGSPAARGGTGVPFDWNAALPMVERIKEIVPVIIAGGLNPDNVADAIRLFEPCGVDVVSGVEREPGKKDAAKLRLSSPPPALPVIAVKPSQTAIISRVTRIQAESKEQHYDNHFHRP